MTVGNKQVELALYDTAGQEDYDQLRILMYPDTDVVVICYSIASPDSLANVVEKWVPEVRQYCPGVPIILCGNKKDLRHNDSVISDLSAFKQKPVDIEDGIITSKQIDASDFHECSALTKAGVMELFNAAAECAMKKGTANPDNCLKCIIM